MFEAFDAFFNIIGTIINFVTSFFGNILFVVQQISKGFVFAGMATLHMPDIIKLFASALFGYAIIINLIHLGD